MKIRTRRRSFVQDADPYNKQNRKTFRFCGSGFKEDRENLYNREWQTEYSAVDKYNFIWTKKGIRCYPKFHIERALVHEYRGSRSLQGDYYNCTLVAKVEPTWKTMIGNNAKH